MNRRVRALRINGYGESARLADTALAEPGPCEATVRVEFAYVGPRERSIVVGNRNIYLPGRKPRFPLTLGYQGGGVVIAAGEASILSPGMRVFINGFVECGRCRRCREGRPHFCLDHALLGLDIDGCLATHVTLPDRCLWPVPDGLPPVAIPGMSEIATAWHGVKRAGRISGRSALVVGCGDIGLTVAALAHLSGVSALWMVDPADAARRRAAELVPEATVTAGEQVGSRAFEVVFEAANSEAGLDFAVRALAPGGTLVTYSALGPTRISVDSYYQQVIQKEISILASHAKSNEDLHDAASLLAQHPLLKSLFDLETTSLDRAGTVLDELVRGERHFPVAVAFPASA